MRAAKSIDELYEEVKGYDIVLCNDAPLALALNNRVDEPRLGPLAVTPRQYAASNAVEITGKPIVGDIAMVKDVADDTGYGLRYVHGEISNIQNMMRFISEPERHLSRRPREVCRAYREQNTVDRVLTLCDAEQGGYFDSMKVAAIGTELFDQLDKHILPNLSKMTEVDVFRRGEYTIPEVRLLGNDREIAECAADIVLRSSAYDVAIVIDTEGPIADTVRSVLYRCHIPFKNSLDVRDLTSIRDFLEFSILSLRFPTLRVRDVRQLISSYGGRIPARFDGYFLQPLMDSGALRSGRAVELLELMRDAGTYTFSQLAKGCIRDSGDMGNVTLLLNEMDCVDTLVNGAVLDDLYYAVNSIGGLNHNEQLSDDEKDGVLLVDCRRSVYVDRPIVIYAGLGSDWDRTTGDLDFLTSGQRLDEDERNRDRFEILMQQGSVRYYLASSVRGGKAVQPCTHFTAVDGGTKVTSFDQIASAVTEGPWRTDLPDRTVRFASEAYAMEAPPEQIFSRSGFNNFFSCPRKYMYSRLSEMVDKDTTFVGTLVHDYVEFRLSHPSIAKEMGAERCGELIAERCQCLHSPHLKDVKRTEIMRTVRNADELADRLAIDPGMQVTRASEKEPNPFLEMNGLDTTSEHTESKHQSSAIHLYGIMDLVDGTRIYDFKTGKAKSAKQIAESFSFDKPADYPDFQPLAYLGILENEGMEDCSITFEYIENKGEDIMLGSGAGASSVKVVIGGTKTECVLELDKNPLGADSYKKIVLSDMLDICSGYGDPSGWQTDGDLIGEVVGRFGVTKRVAENAIKQVAKAMMKESFPSDGVLCVPKETMERFLRLVADAAEENVRYYSGVYPPKPLKGCDKCDYRDMCTIEPISGGEEDVA